MLYDLFHHLCIYLTLELKHKRKAFDSGISLPHRLQPHWFTHFDFTQSHPPSLWHWFLFFLFSHTGVYSFGLFTTTIFANAGQVVTGHQTPHFLTACKPNYTALGCQSPLQYITEHRACSGNPYLVASARKSFPSKDAALSFYSAIYTVVGNFYSTVGNKQDRLWRGIVGSDPVVLVKQKLESFQ